MEILTLLKANIRHRKGSFVSIIILMLIISMSFTAIISIKDNCVDSIENALDKVNAADLTLFLNNATLNDELLDSVENHSSVKNVAMREVVASSGAEFGDNKDANRWMMTKLTDEYRVLNDDMTDYADETPELNKGEMYISQGINTNLGCDIGDKIRVATVAGIYEFTIKGFVVEPICGSMNMGYKIVFISDEDFAQLQNKVIENATEDLQADFRIMHIYKADESISDSKFKRQLNLDTGIVDYAFGSLQQSQSFEYTNIFPDIVLSVLLVFVFFLVAIVLIVMAHSITTSIEMEYTSLGVLKAQGFTENKIKMIFAAQYLFAEGIGAVIGWVLALPFIKFFGGIFQPILALPTEKNISVLSSLLFVLCIIAVSALFVMLATRKVGKISPMKAISGGKNDIHFDSRLKAPVSKKALSPSLALRQFTSNKRSYIGTIIIIGILMFFMITMNVLCHSMDSKAAVKSMGMPMSEVSFTCKERISDDTVEEIESVIKKHTEIENKYYLNNMYMSLNGSEYLCSVYKNPDSIVMSEGRSPEYDNEIAVTDILAEELNLKTGDKVIVSKRDCKSECIITGICVIANDLGLTFAMPLEAAKKLGLEDIFYYAYSITDVAKCTAIADELNDKYSDIITATANESDPTLDIYTLVLDAMTAIIYAISILFSLVVVLMVCKKAFLQERRDIGIYKSLGFTSNKLRLQFAVRFLIVSLIGSAVGSVLSVLLTEDVLTMVFRLVGISSFNAKFNVVSFIVPIAIIAVSFFVFAYFASRKIKKVEIKELVVE